jgi:hypothetical protein
VDAGGPKLLRQFVVVFASFSNLPHLRDLHAEGVLVVYPKAQHTGQVFGISFLFKQRDDALRFGS